MFLIITNTYFENSWYSKALNMGFSTHEIITNSSAGQWKCTVRLWRTVWRLLKKLEIELPYNPAIPLLGIHIKETRIERDTCTPMFNAALFIIARTLEASKMSISRWMDKSVVVLIYNGISLSYEKECIWISSNEVDETGACYTEWSKSERKTPIQYINTYIWNLERW